jgi:endonuclease III related protein
VTGYLENSMTAAAFSVKQEAPVGPPQESSDLPLEHAPKRVLMEFYDQMSAALGPMHWWPAKTQFEVIVGAILTQNTAWTNVKLALANLRRERLLNPQAMADVPLRKLERLIRSSGYFRQKARKLKAFLEFLEFAYGGSLTRMFGTPTAELREKLLAVHGIGPETADSILLYAGRHPIFVVDAYTKRLLGRHSLISEKATYDEVQQFFMRYLPADQQHFNEYHALIVNVGKKWCRAREPRCSECPLGKLLPIDVLLPGRIRELNA